MIREPSFILANHFDQLRDDDVIRRMEKGEQFIVYNQQTNEWFYPIPFENTVALCSFPTEEQILSKVTVVLELGLPKV